MAAFNPGDEIDGQYQVLADLGEGGMGAVLEVQDQGNNYFALKYCKIPDPSVVRRFSREVRVMAGIKHPHLVRVIKHNLNHDPPYFVMPLAEGTLEDELATLATDENAALDAFEHICLGVQAIHNSDAIHRDIKPGNALRMSDGRVVVSDLGLAKFHDRDSTTLTQAGDFIGTRIYCAPEQLIPDGSRDADERTDIFQLGKTLYHLLTGKWPSLIDPSLVDPGLAHVIQRATRDNPDNRYANIGELLDAMNIYRRSKDPTNNPREAMEQLIQEAEENLQNNEYDSDNVRAMLHMLTLSNVLSSETIVDLFDNIPRKLLPIFAGEFANELEPALASYAAAVEDNVGGRGFSYAEKVAARMEILFKNTGHVGVRVLALRATLIAAVKLNRFAAMGTFNDLIKGVQAGEAMAVADMLRQNENYYKRVAEQIPSDQLFPAIREVRERVLAEPV